MYLCDDGHPEVCYECRTCPVCDLINDLEVLKAESEGLKFVIDDLQEKLRNAESS